MLRHSRHTFTAAWVVLATVAVASCDGDEATKLEQTRVPIVDTHVAMPARISEPELDVEALRDLVVRELSLDRESIDVSANDGVVKLNARVPAVGVAQKVIELAEAAPGVRAIVDEIEIAAPELDDLEIERNIERRLVNDAASDVWRIHVTVDDGKANLRGVVASGAEKLAAERAASFARGVTAVDSDIRLAPPVVRSDVEIQRDMRSMLALDRILTNARVQVAYDEGRATLTGRVESPRQRRRARTIAFAFGATEVDDTAVDIDDTDDRTAPMRPAPPTEQELLVGVRLSVSAEPFIDTDDVAVTVDGSTIGLAGTTSTLLARRRIERAALAVRGVTRVDNDIRIAADDAPLGDELEQLVKAHVEATTLLEDVDVEMRDGTAVLRGTVPSRYALDIAAETVEGLPGVRSIDLDLEVVNPSTVPSDG